MKRNTFKKWTPEEKEYMISNYKTTSAIEISIHLNRPLQSIYSYASKTLKIKRKWKGKFNSAWKETNYTYGAIHKWVKENKFKPEKCTLCKQRVPKELSNIDHKYKRRLKDYRWLCISCHRKHDLKMRTKR